MAEASGDSARALSAYARLLAGRPYGAAGERARARILAMPPETRTAFLRELRARGEAALAREDARAAVAPLLPAALLGDPAARDLLRLAYRELPGYADILLAPEITDATLPTLCGDAAACRLIQLGLAEEASPIVRDARRLDTILGCMAAARLAEQADAGPFALDAAEALDRKVPDDFLLELAPVSVRRALAPRPFDRLVAEAAASSGVPPRPPLRRHAAGEPVRPRGGLSGGGPRPDAAHPPDRRRGRARAARGAPRLPPALRAGPIPEPRRADAEGPPRPLLGRRRRDDLRVQRGRGPDDALGRRGAGARTRCFSPPITYVETRTYLRRVLAHRTLYRLAEPEAH